MKAFYFFVALYLTCTSLSQAQFISNDGEYHFAAGALISGATYAIVYTSTKNKKKAFWYSLGASTLAGVAKEVLDSQKEYNKFDAADVAATTLGGLTVSLTLELLVGKRKKRKEANIALVN
ncbi:hypothetical protein VOI54_17155 [Tamlana sp. 2201CG12-4]|uniref:hypothetical protein n=1 Tax=Tamlana sp. 2201CG12-4 TaxID=3112582 RepID=UPI002DB8A0F0|nr:hypothetical protein [Tamlana sp. 2201CG12-4]MEC3908759.1 hypothetical protein [Tamlana sp. 2201CG12-4]